MHPHTGPSPAGREEVAANRAVAPYLDIIDTYQERASHHSAVLSARARDEDRIAASAALAELLREVRRSRELFEADVARLRDNSRIDDVRRSFAALETRLQRMFFS